MALELSKKCLVVVTGASRGIGRAIAVGTARRLGRGSVVALIARSQPGLEETRALICGEGDDAALTVLTFAIDLAELGAGVLDRVLDALITPALGADVGVLFHNAGHVGEVRRATDLADVQQWRSYFDLNLFSAAALTSAFVRRVRPIAPQLAVVNVTSLCGRQPFLNLAQYGAAKAARDLYFKVLALEEPQIRVLNYSPGPVDTDMFSDIIATAQSEEVRRGFELVKNTDILTPAQTVEKLLEILEKGQYKSGDTVDYYD